MPRRPYETVPEPHRCVGCGAYCECGEPDDCNGCVRCDLDKNEPNGVDHDDPENNQS